MYLTIPYYATKGEMPDIYKELALLGDPVIVQDIIKWNGLPGGVRDDIMRLGTETQKVVEQYTQTLGTISFPEVKRVAPYSIRGRRPGLRSDWTSPPRATALLLYGIAFETFSRLVLRYIVEKKVTKFEPVEDLLRRDRKLQEGIMVLMSWTMTRCLGLEKMKNITWPHGWADFFEENNLRIKDPRVFYQRFTRWTAIFGWEVDNA